MGEPAAGEDLEIEQLAHERRRAQGFRVAARRALALARRYRHEEGPRGERERACVDQALAWRASARDAASGLVVGPGLARASSRAAAAGRRAG